MSHHLSTRISPPPGRAKPLGLHGSPAALPCPGTGGGAESHPLALTFRSRVFWLAYGIHMHFIRIPYAADRALTLVCLEQRLGGRLVGYDPVDEPAPQRRAQRRQLARALGQGDHHRAVPRRDRRAGGALV